MKQVSFIHTADIHLDAPFSSLGDSEKADIRRKELAYCLNKIIETVKKQGIDLLIISGDFFEGSHVRSSIISKARNLFSEIFNTEVIIIPGNHDPATKDSYYRTAEWGDNVHIILDSKQVLFLEKFNTCIYNIGATGNAAADYLAVKEKNISGGTFNILVFHGTIDMPFAENNYNSMSSEEILALGMDYVALGHMHNYTRVQNTTTVMINPGSPEPLGFDEEGIHGIIIGRFTWNDGGEKKVEADFVPFSSRSYRNVDIDVTGCSDDNDIIKKINMSQDFGDSLKDLYRITLKGFIPKSLTPDIKFILESLEKKCFYLRIKNETSIQFDFAQYLEDPGIKGEFVRMLLDMREGEVSEEKKETIFMALQYGLQAMESNRIE